MPSLGFGHLDTCQFKTFLHARIPRVDCPEHGVLQVKVPWAEAKGRFTLLMERLIIDVLRECATVTGTCRLLRISWDEAWNVMDRAVRRGQGRKKAKPARYLGVDEKAFRKGHDYMTMVCDLLGGTVEYVAEERKTESEDHRLKGTKYLWLYREENLPDKHRPTLKALKATTLKVAKAWAMKESLSALWNYLSVGWARRFMKRWLIWVKNRIWPRCVRSARCLRGTWRTS